MGGFIAITAFNIWSLAMFLIVASVMKRSQSSQMYILGKDNEELVRPKSIPYIKNIYGSLVVLGIVSSYLIFFFY